jgi:sec-independent protein translocase protein TatA
MIEGILAPWHLIILVVVLLLIFGPSKLPGIASSLGKAVSGVRKEIKEISEESSGMLKEVKDLNPLSGIDLKPEGDPPREVVSSAEKGAEKTAAETPEKNVLSASTLRGLASPGGRNKMAVAATIKKATSPTAVLGKLLLSEGAVSAESPEDKGSETGLNQ